MSFQKFLIAAVVFLGVEYAHAAANTNLEPRIINGYSAKLNDTRHQVSIRHKLLDSFIFGLGHLCGGSLISSNIVLTAAHCLRDSENEPVNETEFIVVMGTLWRNISDNNTLVYNVKKYMSHPAYNRSLIANDIGYIVLDGKVPDNHPIVKPIQLADSKVAVENICQVTGWGLTEENIASDQLLAVDVPTIDILECNQAYGGTLFVKGQLCAGYMEGGKDACVGDSGGPLVCNGKLTGIVSFGEGCGEKNKPGVYTDVFYFKDWIPRSVGTNNKQSIFAPAVVVALIVFYLM